LSPAVHRGGRPGFPGAVSPVKRIAAKAFRASARRIRENFVRLIDGTEAKNMPRDCLNAASHDANTIGASFAAKYRKRGRPLIARAVVDFERSLFWN
jgi:hypothetical protein